LPLGISLSELARRVSLDKAGLSRAAKRGRIPRLPDGTYDEAAVRKALKENTEPSRSHFKIKPVDAPTTVNEAEAADAISLVKRLLQGEGRDTSGPLTFDDARTAETVLKVRQRDQEIERDKGNWVPKAPLLKHLEDSFAAYRKELQALPARYGAQIAAEVGCDVTALDRAFSKVIRDHLDGLSAPLVRG
jgi:hypothetical protein